MGTQSLSDTGLTWDGGDSVLGPGALDEPHALNRTGPLERTCSPLRLRLWFLLLVLSCAVGCEGEDGPTGDDGLGVSLREVGAIGIPSDWTVLEVAAAGSASQVLYLADPSRLVWLPDTINQVATPYRRIVGMRAVDEGTIEVFDGALKEVVTVRQGEGVTARLAVPAIDSKVWDARWIDGTWYLSVGDSTGPPRILALSPENGFREVGDPVRGLETRAALVGAIGREVVLAEITAPFRVGRLRQGRWLLTAPTASRELSSPQTMVALAVLPLGGHGIQSIIDVRSARRVLRIIGPGRTGERRREVHVPLAVVGTTADDLLLALRQTDVQELVAYSWERR